MSNVDNLRKKETKRTILIRIIKKLVEISGTNQRHRKTLSELSNEFV